MMTSKQRVLAAVEHRATDRVPITFFISQIVYGMAAVGSVSIGAALCVLLMAVQITAMAISNYILKQKVAFLGV